FSKASRLLTTAKSSWTIGLKSQCPFPRRPVSSRRSRGLHPPARRLNALSNASRLVVDQPEISHNVNTAQSPFPRRPVSSERCHGLPRRYTVSMPFSTRPVSSRRPRRDEAGDQVSMPFPKASRLLTLSGLDKTPSIESQCPFPRRPVSSASTL